MNDRADRQREHAARWSRKEQAKVADIGELPPITDPKRRADCERNLHLFLQTYFPASTGLSPFGPEQVEAIERIQRCALDGGLFLSAFPRGFSKTTISENAAIWAVLYGHRRFVPIFGADASAAAGNIDSIKLELSENDLLYADFPEVCHAIRALEGKPQRCASQTYASELTHIAWTSDTIVLPTIPGSAGGGAILTAHGIGAASRGMKHKRPDGTQQRPDFVIIDDPQTDETASTPLQVNKRMNVIRKSILKLGGHNRKIAVVMNATVIKPGDLIEQIFDPKKFPGWQGMRIKMVKAWSKVHDTLWLEDYQRIRNTFDRGTLGDQQRAHRQATEFYRTNRAKMDDGCAVSWENCFDRETEISAIQHAYNLLIDDGAEVFASECQNEPIPDEVPADDDITTDLLAEKLNRQERGAIPVSASRLVGFIDVQKPYLPWMVCAFEDGFSGYIIDYGTYPKQERRTYYTRRDAKTTLEKVLGTKSLEEMIYGGLDRLVGELMAREWRRADGALLRPERIPIDFGWGESSDTIFKFCQQSPHSAVLMPSKGMFVGATSRAFNDYKPKPGERTGLNWRMPNMQGKRALRYLLFDANAWKTFVRSRLRVPMGGKGCLSVFGADSTEHRLLFDHWTSERGIEATAKGRTVVEWKERPTRMDNDFWDCLVGCHVAAAERGATLMKDVATAPAAQIKLSDLQKMKRKGRA